MRIIHWIACVSVLCAVLMWPHASTTAQTADLHDLDAFIARALKEYQVPGAAIAVVQDGNVVVAKGYGVRDMTKPSAVDENTIFQLASVTKSLTGAAAASVVDEGKLDWDIPIFHYLPAFVGYDPYMTRWLTERDLLAMRTGGPRTRAICSIVSGMTAGKFCDGCVISNRVTACAKWRSIPIRGFSLRAKSLVAPPINRGMILSKKECSHH